MHAKGKVGRNRRWMTMTQEEMEDMTIAELLKIEVAENTTRKILAIMEESKDLEEAKRKVKELLSK